MKTNIVQMKMYVRGAAFLLLLSAVLVSCKRDFPNPNAPIIDDVPVQSIVTGAEAGMRVDYAIYLRVVSVLAREAYYFEPADPRYTGELLQGTPDPGGFLLNRPWAGRYRTIANCNFLLTKAAGLGGAARAGVEGFAKTIMAYQLLLNLNYLGDSVKLDFTGDLNAPFAKKDEALARIAALLDEANTNLGAAGGAFPFRLTSGFSGFDTPPTFARFNRALAARVAVYRGRFAEALTALGLSFISTTAPMSLGVYHVYGTGLGDQLNEIFEAPDAPFVKLMAHPSFATQATSGDTRLTRKTFLRSAATTFDDLTSNRAVTITSSSTDRVPIIRNEELLLLRAEANIGLSNFGTAETDINLIRAAAGLGPITITSANALTSLLHEKRYSLFMEGHRWIDLRRYGRLGQLPIDRPGRDVILVNMPAPETERRG